MSEDSCIGTVPLRTSHRGFPFADLCEFQVNPDVRTTTGITPLMLASYAGHTDACQILLDSRALTAALRPLADILAISLRILTESKLGIVGRVLLCSESRSSLFSGGTADQCGTMS